MITPASIDGKYPEATLLVNLAHSVWSGNQVTAKIELPIPEKLRAECFNLLGTHVQTIFITDSNARHIKKQHGSGEDKRGQADITPKDFALIPLVLNEFDTAEHTGEDKKGNRRILLTKKIGGTIYLATIERGPYKMEIRTFWKMREPGTSC